MSLNDHFKHVLPLLETSPSLFELAELGCLPSYLNDDSLAQLRFPKSEIQQGAFKKVLRTEMRNGNLKTLTIEEFGDLVMGAKEKLTPEKYREPKPQLPRPPNTIVGELPAITGALVATSDSDIIPGDEHKEHNKRRIYVVHREDFKKWLEKEGDWPLDPSIPLSKWWSDLDQHSLPTMSVHEEDIAADENIFHLAGDKFIVQFNGNRSYFEDRIGMKYISILLQSPGKEFHAQQLQLAVSKVDPKDIVGTKGVIGILEQKSMRQDDETNGFPDQGRANNVFWDQDRANDDDEPVIDNQAAQSYMQEIKNLDRQIQDAEDNNDFSTKEKLESERDQVLEEFSKVTGLRGKSRQFSDNAEKARKAVSNAINRVITKIKKEDASLAKHLKSSISLGEYCRYDPEHKIDWKL